MTMAIQIMIRRTSIVFCAALLSAIPAWAVNKCTGTYGQTIFQDAPCAGGGVTVAEDVARKQAAAAQKKEEQERLDAVRKAKEDAEREANKAQRKAADKSANELIAEARSRCTNGLPEYPKIGMTEFEFQNCTTWGLLVKAETVNQIQTALGNSRQYVYPSGREIRYLYINNGGIVSAIQR